MAYNIYKQVTFGMLYELGVKIEEQDEILEKPISKGKRRSGRAQRRRDSYLAKHRKMARLYTDETDERKLRIIGEWEHDECNGWWTEKEIENRRKSLRGPFAKCELHIPEPNISKVKVNIHA